MIAYQLLDGKLTAKDRDAEGWVKGVFAVSLDTLLGIRSYADFLDLLSYRLTDTELLQDISYRIVGHEKNILHLEVQGDASECWPENAT